MRRRLRSLITILVNAVLLSAILIFAKGFFPHKAVLPGLATWPTNPTGLLRDPPFDKVIFMVVDALRSDFVYSNSSAFHYTQDLIREGGALPYTGHARPPTITMPRVKSITTGSVPSFLDLVLSFDESDTSSTLATQDSWLAQLKAQQTGKLVMYGDDTWLRLFPKFFDRSDGTTSFFVSDFTEVDNNVTRHVPNELRQSDWSGMILHYLGLDHIGHKTGPRGPNMLAKQREMDGIVKLIYEAMTEQGHLSDCLLVLLGDHGMNDAGNHGANSAGEVSTALTFISPKFKFSPHQHTLQSPLPANDDFTFYRRVDQADLAATLAALLGFPVPKNNLGVMISDIVRLFTSDEDYMHLLHENAAQIAAIAQATYPQAFEARDMSRRCATGSHISDEEDLACLWHVSRERDAGHVQLQAFLDRAQAVLSSTASQYDMGKLYIGLGLAAIAAITSAPLSLKSLATNYVAGGGFVLIVLLYSLTLFASSYVEEEQQFWYWTTSAWLFLLTVKSHRIESNHLLSQLESVAVLLLFGITRRWNQTGQKYAGQEDLLNVVLKPNPSILWFLVLLTHLGIASKIVWRLAELGARKLTIVPIVVISAAFAFKIGFTTADAPELIQDAILPQALLEWIGGLSLVSLARLVFAGLGTLMGILFYLERSASSKSGMSTFCRMFHDVVSLFTMMQSRITNLPLFLAFHLQLRTLQTNQYLDELEVLLTTLFMQYSSFFAFGGTNAISSVDLSNAYNGIAGFNVFAVGVLVFVSNWAGPVWWASGMACMLQNRTPSHSINQESLDYFSLLTFFNATNVLATMAACTILREHLFIWTVFSPKYLYMMAWVLGQHMVVNGLFCGVITLSR